MNSAKRPVEVQCKQCGYKWIGVFLPLPIEDAIRVLQSLCCPMCAAPADRICMLFGLTAHVDSNTEPSA